MSTIEEIEHAVEKLDKKELSSLQNWFAHHDAAQWDAQFEEDVASGKLDLIPIRTSDLGRLQGFPCRELLEGGQG